MAFIFEILDFTAELPLSLVIPEAAGLLGFGIGLVSVAVILRKFLGRHDIHKTNGKLSE